MLCFVLLIYERTQGDVRDFPLVAFVFDFCFDVVDDDVPFLRLY